jgi:hypothetical protein
MGSGLSSGARLRFRSPTEHCLSLIQTGRSTSTILPFSLSLSKMISGVATVDAGAQEPLAQDVLDLSQYDAKVSVTGATIGVNGTSFNNFEKLILSSSANTVKVTSLSSVGGLQEIDAGANPPGSADVMDFSSSSPGINFSNSSVSQGNATLKLTNFEDLIGSSSNDTIDLSNSSIQFVNGSAGDDTMTAGSGGSTLDGSTGNNVYIGGDGIDTFVIGNGEYAQQGTNATFEIQNASASDRLVLRLDELPGLVTAQIGPKGSSSTGESIFRAIRSMPVSIPLYTSRQASFRQAISRGLRSFHARMSGPSSGTIPLTMNGTARSSTSRSRPRTEISG